MPPTDATLAKAALNLLAQIAAQPPGATTSSRLGKQFRSLLADAEGRLPEPAFAPEQFAYLPITCFDGQRIEGVDMAFAALFAVADTRFPLATWSADTPKVASWRLSLGQWQRAVASPSLESIPTP